MSDELLGSIELKETQLHSNQGKCTFRRCRIRFPKESLSLSIYLELPLLTTLL